MLSQPELVIAESNLVFYPYQLNVSTVSAVQLHTTNIHFESFICSCELVCNAEWW